MSGTLRVGQGGLSVELVREAQQRLQSNGGKLSADDMTQLEQMAVRSGRQITQAERQFIANLDNQALVQQLTQADFNPVAARFTVNPSDTSLRLADGRQAEVGSGQSVFQNGQANTAALRQFTQRNNTSGANAACSCNASVAALAARGPEALSASVSRLIARISPPSANQREDFNHLTRIQQDIEAGTATTQDLNQLASYLYRTYDSNQSDHQMVYDDVIRMRRDLGLADASTQRQTFNGPNVGQVTFSLAPPNRGQIVSGTVNPASAGFRQAQAQTAQQVLAAIPANGSALVGVFNGPPGQTDQSNHFIEVGRNAQGEVYVYDSLAQPNNYLTGADAERHLQSKINISFGASQIVGATETYQISTGASIVRSTAP